MESVDLCFVVDVHHHLCGGNGRQAHPQNRKADQRERRFQKSTEQRNPSPAVFAFVKCCMRSEEHTSELQSLRHLVCRLLLEKKKKKEQNRTQWHTPLLMLTSALELD